MSTTSVPIAGLSANVPGIPKPATVSERLACILCYAMGPVGGVTALASSELRRIWVVRFHACHSLLMCGLLMAGWALLTLAEAVMPWFPSVVLREIRLVAVIGSVPVWILAMLAAWKGWRYSPVPLLHEMAIRSARHFDETPAARGRSV